MVDPKRVQSEHPQLRKLLEDSVKHIQGDGRLVPPIQLQLSNVVCDVRVRPNEPEEVWDAIPAVIALGTVLEGLYIHCTVEQGLGDRSPPATDQRTGGGGRLVVLEPFKDSAFEFRRKLRQCVVKADPIYICLLRVRHCCANVVGYGHRRCEGWELE